MQIAHQHNTMQSESDILQRNGTWDLVPLALNQNIIGSKWVFYIKQKCDKSFERYKAHLVIKEFRELLEVNYNATFSPVIELTTIPIVLYLAFTNNQPIHQLDVNNAFLNGQLMEKVYMPSPLGFVNSSHPNYISRLNKAI